MTPPKGIEDLGDGMIAVDTDALQREEQAESNEFHIVCRNPFYAGWLGFILGQEKPGGEHGIEGWKMALETFGPASIRSRDIAAIRASVALGHISVRTIDL